MYIYIYMVYIYIYIYVYVYTRSDFRVTSCLQDSVEISGFSGFVVGLAFLPHTCYALLTAVNVVRPSFQGSTYSGSLAPGQGGELPVLKLRVALQCGVPRCPGK